MVLPLRQSAFGGGKHVGAKRRHALRPEIKGSGVGVQGRGPTNDCFIIRPIPGFAGKFFAHNDDRYRGRTSTRSYFRSRYRRIRRCGCGSRRSSRRRKSCRRPPGRSARTDDRCPGPACSFASGTATSILILGTKSTVYSVPRYISVWPFWRPNPRTSVIGHARRCQFRQGVFDVFQLEVPDDRFDLFHRKTPAAAGNLSRRTANALGSMLLPTLTKRGQRLAASCLGTTVVLRLEPVPVFSR